MIHRIAAPLALALALTVPGSAQPRNSKLTASITSFAREKAFSGTVLVRERGKTVLQRSFGIAEREFGVPIANDTRFRVASITKAFTAVLVLQLHDQGRLDLGATIGKYLPDYPGDGAERITIHHLLNHTSGMANLDTVSSYAAALRNGVEIYQKPQTPEQLLSACCRGTLVREPGKAFDYNNAEYILLGRIIEKLTGKPYTEVLTERILAPLGMTSSGMLVQRNIVGRLARAYMLGDDGKSLTNELPFYFENVYSAGAMYSTAVDLAKFAEALFGGRLLKRETLALMLTPGLDEYGYGVWINKMEIGGKSYRAVWRHGNIMGATTLLLHLPERDLTVILLSNTNATDLGAFGSRIAKVHIGG